MTRTAVNDLGQRIGEPVPSWTGCPRPAPTELSGRWCRLEALSLTHADALRTQLCSDPTGRLWTYLPFGPFGPGEPPEQFAGLVHWLIEDPELVPLAVVDPADGTPCGTASYLRIDEANGCVEVGAIIFGPRLRRTTAATEAMYLMARHVFEELGYRRYEWKCDALNAASVAAARRLGFRPEGTWRNATVYKGRNRDTAWFAMTDADWAELRPAFEAWLDPASSVDGVQRFSLSAATAAIRARLDEECTSADRAGNEARDITAER